MSKYGVISGPYFPVFSPNTGKYGPEITPYLDTFYAVSATKNICSKCEVANYRRGIQKNKSYRIEYHYPKKTVEMVWENNQSRQFST